MKKLLIGIGVLSLALALSPAQAKQLKKKSIEFSATPCAAVCSYWVSPDHAQEGIANLDPTTIDPTTADPLDVADMILTLPASDSSACEHPGPVGTYDDVVVKAPKKANFLVFEAQPEVDWDIFICAKPKKGQTGSKMLAKGANTIGDDLSGEDLCTAGIGCAEKAQISVKAGKKYVLRAYNWSDPSNLPATYTFFHV